MAERTRLDAVDRMFAELRDVASAKEASMYFATVSPNDGEIHSCVTWFAPLFLPTDDEVRLLSLSAPTRIHSGHIQLWEAMGRTAKVSGAIRKDGQPKNNPNCHGVTNFNGEARTVRSPEEIDRALATFAVYNSFDPANLEKYLEHSYDQIPTHEIFEFTLHKADVMDGRLGDDNPERLVRLGWTTGEGWTVRS